MFTLLFIFLFLYGTLRGRGEKNLLSVFPLHTETNVLGSLVHSQTPINADNVDGDATHRASQSAANAYEKPGGNPRKPLASAHLLPEHELTTHRPHVSDSAGTLAAMFPTTGGVVSAAVADCKAGSAAPNAAPGSAWNAG